MPAALTYAVGDIHGCLGKLERLMRACETHAAGRAAHFVFLGDYVDRGPHSRGVVEFLMRRQQARPDAVVCLMGNHEQMAVNAHDHDGDAVAMWLRNGGGRTQRSYWRSGGRITPAHLDWMRSLPLFHDDGLRFFVHAGIDPRLPLHRQRDDVMLWIREPFLSSREITKCGRFIVHGHTPLATGKPDLAEHRVNLDTGAVVGGPLTAAIFDAEHAAPVGFLTDGRARSGWLGRSRA